MTLPFALCAVAKARTKLSRDVLLFIVLVSVFPLVFSLNRANGPGSTGAFFIRTRSRGRRAAAAGRTL